VIKVMKNIMIVVALIMLQMQSAYASGEELGCLNSDRPWEVFVSRHSRLCHLEAKMLDCLKYLERNSCLHKGMCEAITRCINEAKDQHPRVQEFLCWREYVLQEVRHLLPVFNKVSEARKTAFAALLERLSIESFLSDRGDDDKDSNLSQPVFVCKSVAGACQQGMQSLKAIESVANEQDQYIGQLDLSLGPRAISKDTCKELDCYKESMREHKKLTQNYVRVLNHWFVKDPFYSKELDLVQYILENERQKKAVTLFRKGVMVSFAVTVCVGMVAWYQLCASLCKQ